DSLSRPAAAFSASLPLLTRSQKRGRKPTPTSNAFASRAGTSAVTSAPRAEVFDAAGDSAAAVLLSHHAGPPHRQSAYHRDLVRAGRLNAVHPRRQRRSL